MGCRSWKPADIQTCTVSKDASDCHCSALLQDRQFHTQTCSKAGRQKRTRNRSVSSERLQIYYWSGTGNSYRVATWLAERWQDVRGAADVTPIEQPLPTSPMCESAKPLLVLVTPTHGFTAPWQMLRFAFRLPPGNACPAYCVATRAGIRLGKWIPPGIAGSCTLLLAFILLLKGYRVRGAMSVNMPSNWTVAHPALGEKSVRLIREKARTTTHAFADKVLQQKQVWITGNNLYELILGLLLAPISIAYLFVGRFFLAKLFFANSRCDGCRICAENCPVGAIRMWGSTRPRPFWKYNCESCMRCSAICPHAAVEGGHSWGVIVYFLTAIPGAYYLFRWLGSMIPALSGLDQTWAGTLVYAVQCYLAIFASYYLFQLALRVSAVNRFFTYTTLTHYWGRYQEPEVKLGQLTRHSHSEASHDPEERTNR